MSRRVFKYEIPVPDHPSMVSDVMLPQRAAIMSVGVQHDRIYAWALVDTDKPERHYAFKVLGTGWAIAGDELDGYTFLDTVQMKAPVESAVGAYSELVWHVWVKP